MQVQLSNVEVYLPQTASPLFCIRELNIARGSKVLIHGPSGKGKTTLLHLIAGLFLPSRGRVRVGDHELTELSDEERSHIRRSQFGVIFQKLNLLDHLTALENVELGLNKSNRGHAQTTLKQVQLSEKENQLTATLSLGEQQRVAVARVLAAQPQVILADEPTSSLDEANAQAVMQSLFKTAPNATLIVVSHDQRINSGFTRVVNFEELVRT